MYMYTYVYIPIHEVEVYRIAHTFLDWTFRHVEWQEPNRENLGTVEERGNQRIG